MRLLIFCAVLLAHNAGAVNIVVNPGFEQGSYGWTLGPVFMVLFKPTPANASNHAAFTACVGPSCMADNTLSYLRQNLATVPGTDYSLSFWVGESGDPTSEMAVYWDGNLVDHILNPANNGLIQLSYPNLHASGASTMLELRGRQDPRALRFDDFVVTADRLVNAISPAAIDTPKPLFLLAAGALMLAWRRWRYLRG